MSMSLFLLCSIRERKCLRKRNSNTLNQKLSNRIVMSRKAGATRCRPLDRDRLQEEFRKCLARLGLLRGGTQSTVPGASGISRNARGLTRIVKLVAIYQCTNGSYCNLQVKRYVTRTFLNCHGSSLSTSSVNNQPLSRRGVQSEYTPPNSPR